MMQVVDYSNSPLSESDIVEIVFGLMKKESPFHRVALRCCQIKEKGARALSRCLKVFPEVYLDLSDNEISGKGAVALLTALAREGNTLDLSMNPVKDEDLKAALSSLCHPPQFQTLILKETACTPCALKAFADKVKGTLIY